MRANSIYVVPGLSRIILIPIMTDWTNQNLINRITIGPFAKFSQTSMVFSPHFVPDLTEYGFSRDDYRAAKQYAKRGYFCFKMKPWYYLVPEKDIHIIKGGSNA